MPREPATAGPSAWERSNAAVGSHCTRQIDLAVELASPGSDRDAEVVGVAAAVDLDVPRFGHFEDRFEHSRHGSDRLPEGLHPTGR